MTHMDTHAYMWIHVGAQALVPLRTPLTGRSPFKWINGNYIHWDTGQGHGTGDMGYLWKHMETYGHICIHVDTYGAQEPSPGPFKNTSHRAIFFQMDVLLTVSTFDGIYFQRGRAHGSLGSCGPRAP